jgi:hypothetical protein
MLKILGFHKFIHHYHSRNKNNGYKGYNKKITEIEGLFHKAKLLKKIGPAPLALQLLVRTFDSAPATGTGRHGFSAGHGFAENYSIPTAKNPPGAG